MIGRSHRPEYYEPIRNTRIRDALQKISAETEEDFQTLNRVLESASVEVIRPELCPVETIMDSTDSDGRVSIRHRPPNMPRDGQVVIGNDMVVTTLFDHPSIHERLNDYSEIDFTLIDYSDDHFDAPFVAVVGNRIILDVKHISAEMEKFIKLGWGEYDIVTYEVGKHNDGCFAILKEGVLLTCDRPQIPSIDYDKLFPRWKRYPVAPNTIESVKAFSRLKKKNEGKWWVPGEEDNDEFTEYVEQWLGSFVGYTAESSFNVNTFMIDEQTMVVPAYDDAIFKILKDNDIEPVVVPRRHSSFWDGGLHCSTLDLKRDGQFNSYF